MKPIPLNIFFYDDEGCKLRELDIDVPLKDCILREVTFYRIDAISSYKEEETEEVEYCSIYANGTSYITPLQYEKVKRMILNL